MEKSGFKTLNTIIFLLSYFVFPLWLICFVSTFWVSIVPFIGVVRCMCVIGKTYRNISRVENGRKKLIKLNAVLILWIAVLHLPGLVLFYFNDTKCMYRIKRLDYIHGVYGYYGKNVGMNRNLLPEKLPDECENYSYFTSGVLTPYHAPSCLIFRTDEGTIERYAEYYSFLCDEIRVINNDSGEKTEKFDKFFKQAGISDESRQEEFGNAVLYWIDGHFPKGAMIDKDSGYVVIMT